MVRRGDPRGRTLGQILRYHVSEPLGADVHIGLTDQGEVVFCRGQVSDNPLHCPELARAVSVDYLRPHQFAVSSLSSLFSLSRPRPRLPVRSLLTTALGMVMKGIIWRAKK